MNKINRILNKFFNEVIDYLQINKSKLKGLLKTNDFLGRVKLKTTDDYAYDNDVNYGKTEWFPVVLDDSNDLGQIKDGKFIIGTRQLMDKNVRVGVNRNTPSIISISFHNFLYLELKDTKGTDFFELPPLDTNEPNLRIEELAILIITFKYKSNFRKDKFDAISRSIGKDMFEKHYDNLIKKGMVNKSGAITLKGKMAIESYDRKELRDMLKEFADRLRISDLMFYI